MFDDHHLSNLCAHPFVTRINRENILSGPFILPRGSARCCAFLAGSCGVPRFIGKGIGASACGLISQVGRKGGRRVSFAGWRRRRGRSFGRQCIYQIVSFLRKDETTHAYFTNSSTKTSRVTRGKRLYVHTFQIRRVR